MERFHGIHTALITPMADGQVDRNSHQHLVEWQIKEGIDGLVAVGTTGESPTLSTDEHLAVIEDTVAYTAGKVPVMAGTGSNSTQEAVFLTERATAAGADAILQVAPYYNKPSPEGLYRHFSAVAQATELPIILYSIPSRCGIEIDVPTVARLHRDHPHICGIKEAGGSCSRVEALREALPETFIILSGDDGLTLPFMSLGAKGVISVASNAVVGELARMVHLALENNFAEALTINSRFAPFFRALFLAPNPVPIKAVLKEMGKITSDEVRLPLAELGDQERDEVMSALAKLDLNH